MRATGLVGGRSTRPRSELAGTGPAAERLPALRAGGHSQWGVNEPRRRPFSVLSSPRRFRTHAAATCSGHSDCLRHHPFEGMHSAQCCLVIGPPTRVFSNERLQRISQMAIARRNRAPQSQGIKPTRGAAIMHVSYTTKERCHELSAFGTNGARGF